TRAAFLEGLERGLHAALAAGACAPAGALRPAGRRGARARERRRRARTRRRALVVVARCRAESTVGNLRKPNPPLAHASGLRLGAARLGAQHAGATGRARRRAVARPAARPLDSDRGVARRTRQSARATRVRDRLALAVSGDVPRPDLLGDAAGASP